MRLTPIALYPPLRMLASLLIGGIISWRIYHSIQGDYQQPALATAAAPAVEAANAAHAAHGIVALYSLVMTVAAAWLTLTAIALLRQSYPWTKHAAPDADRT